MSSRLRQPPRAHRPTVSRARVRCVWGALLSSRIAACGPAEPDECLLDVNTDCQPRFAPTYTNIYRESLRGSCGGPGSSCHGPDGAMAGLVFANEQDSYDLLLGNVGGRPRVIPFDPNGSLLLQRLECAAPERRMPLNSDPLPASVRCAIAQWIEAGAPR